MPGMSANLSHRGAVAVNTIRLSRDEQRKFIKAAVTAGTFGNLPQKWKDYILAAEKEITDAGYTLHYPQDDS
jgi:hypothetical protein